MKKFIILLMSITCLLLASCTCKSKDERAADVGIADVVHDGHKYVVFHSKKGYGDAMYVLHSIIVFVKKTNDYAEG